MLVSVEHKWACPSDTALPAPGGPLFAQEERNTVHVRFWCGPSASRNVRRVCLCAPGDARPLAAVAAAAAAGAGGKENLAADAHVMQVAALRAPWPAQR